MKISHWLAATLTALCTALLPGCDASHLAKIQPGTTAADAVRQIMGEPGFIHWNDDGTATWEYSRQPAGVDCYMISFDRAHIVRQIEQVLTPTTYGRIRPGQSRDDVRRLLGRPGSTMRFDNLGEDIWEWRIRGDMPTDETYFMVHFDLQQGGVKKTSQRVQPKG
ncbi:MAG: hypothetical protein PHT48_10780 [Dechloromonas sp.]|nr:hypothetical protein [Dechloromonas sp.]